MSPYNSYTLIETRQKWNAPHAPRVWRSGLCSVDCLVAAMANFMDFIPILDLRSAFAASDDESDSLLLVFSCTLGMGDPGVSKLSVFRYVFLRQRVRISSIRPLLFQLICYYIFACCSLQKVSGVSSCLLDPSNPNLNLVETMVSVVTGFLDLQ